MRMDDHYDLIHIDPGVRIEWHYDDSPTRNTSADNSFLFLAGDGECEFGEIRGGLQTSGNVKVKARRVKGNAECWGRSRQILGTVEGNAESYEDSVQVVNFPNGDEEIERLKEAAANAQRSDPGCTSEETKEAQRSYDRAQMAMARAFADAEKLAAEKAERVRESELREKIRRLYINVSEGDRLVLLTRKDAEWIGNAPQVAGGWVATRLPIELAKRPDHNYPALIRNGGSMGVEIRPEMLRDEWLDKYGFGLEELEDVYEKLNSISISEQLPISARLQAACEFLENAYCYTGQESSCALAVYDSGLEFLFDFEKDPFGEVEVFQVNENGVRAGGAIQKLATGIAYDAGVEEIIDHVRETVRTMKNNVSQGGVKP